MKLRNEVAAFLNIINVYFHPEKELDQALFSKVNWKKFEKALEFHAIRPIVYDILKHSKIIVPNKLLKNLEIFSTAQAVSHLSNSLELKRLESVFQKASIPMISFKGVAYQKALYTTGLREAGDMDLLVNKEQLPSALVLLWNDGYTFSIPQIFSSIEDYISLFEKAPEQCETPLIKKNLHVDLHWDIHHSFLPYKLPVDFIQSLETDTEQIFWTLVNHHGAKEFWLRLKHLIDLAAFLEKYGDNFDWPKAYTIACQTKMSTVFLNGFFLVSNKLNVELPPYIKELLIDYEYKAYHKTIRYWNIGKTWATTLPRLRYEQILLLSQDSGFNKWMYFKDIYKTYTKPNPIEPKRYLYFPERFHFLNFLSKVFSYLIKKTFGIK